MTTKKEVDYEYVAMFVFWTDLLLAVISVPIFIAQFGALTVIPIFLSYMGAMVMVFGILGLFALYQGIEDDEFIQEVTK